MMGTGAESEPLGFLPCLGGSGLEVGGKGAQVGLAFPSISVSSWEGDHPALPRRLPRGPRPMLTSPIRRRLPGAGAALCSVPPSIPFTCCQPLPLGEGGSPLVSPWAFTDAPNLDKPCWLWDLQTPRSLGAPRCSHQRPHCLCISPPPHLVI